MQIKPYKLSTFQSDKSFGSYLYFSLSLYLQVRYCNFILAKRPDGNPSIFKRTIYPEWSLQKSGRNHRIWIKNGRKQYKDTDPYYPRLTAYDRQDERTGRVIRMVNIEFSVAKLLYNNNLNEVDDKDIQEIIKTLKQKLSVMGEIISEANLTNASISGFDPAKNIVLGDGYICSAVIRELGKINVSKKLELTKITFKNDGQALQIYSKNYSVVFYDKIADLNQKKHRAVDKDQTPPTGLAVKNEFEKTVWSSVYTAPSLVQKQMRELLIASGHKDPLYPKPLDASSPIYGQPVRTYNR